MRGTLSHDGIAMIGARDAAEEERAFARALAAALCRPIVAGLAPGIDDAAHRGALEAGQPTVAYLGSGLSRAENPALADTIVAGGGAVTSEYGPSAPATAWSRKRRDRLHAAHAGAVVLVVTDTAGGAMHTIRFAGAYGRPRFTLATEASGNRLALAEGALPVPWETRAAVRIITASL